jgi:acyl-CoA synthetase (NDP forming)
MKPFLDDGRYGSLVLAVVLSSQTHSERKMAPIIAALTDFGPPKPVVFAMLGEDSEVSPEIIARLRALGVPFFRSPERALRALARLAGLRAPQLGSSACPEVTRADKRLPAGVIPEYLAKRFLAEAGIPVPCAQLVTKLPDAQRAAARIGFPVVLKAQSPALAHKSDAGGVILRLADDAALVAAWSRLHGDIAKARPGLRLDGVLVEAMARPGVELIVGVRGDPDWGPVLMVGLGGVWAEALRDVRVLPPDLDPAAIVGEFRKLKAALLMTGFRGAPALDLGAVAEIASRLSRFAAARPEIAEIDVNPLVVYPEQEGAVALDALIVAP